jgi:hypothetical protein
MAARGVRLSRLPATRSLDSLEPLRLDKVPWLIPAAERVPFDQLWK